MVTRLPICSTVLGYRASGCSAHQGPVECTVVMTPEMPSCRNARSAVCVKAMRKALNSAVAAFGALGCHDQCGPYLALQYLPFSGSASASKISPGRNKLGWLRINLRNLSRYLAGVMIPPMPVPHPRKLERNQTRF